MEQKNLLEEFSKNNSFAKHINADNLSEIYDSRIERIAHCRNISWLHFFKL